jgi:hypothetical protein
MRFLFPLFTAVSASLWASTVFAQTIDLVCEGDIKTDIIVSGVGHLAEPVSIKTSKNYHFLNGRLMKSERYPDRKVNDDLECVWSRGEIKCSENHEICLDARRKGAIPPELSFCQNSLEINRYNGTVTAVEGNFHSNFANRGRTIFTRTFKGKCEFSPKQKF